MPILQVPIREIDISYTTGAGNTHALFIIGGAEDGEEGYYALIAERTNSLTGRYAYVSEIIELYIKDR